METKKLGHNVGSDLFLLHHLVPIGCMGKTLELPWIKWGGEGHANYTTHESSKQNINRIQDTTEEKLFPE
jgi:hypothetical protein